MKNFKRVLGTLFLIGILLAAYIWFFIINKPHRNFEKAKPDITMNAQQCYNEASQNKLDPGGKVIEVYGVPSSIENSDSLVVVVFAFKQGMFGSSGIRCTMLDDNQKKALALSTRDTTYIKGFCAGYNGTDVIMEHCSIIYKPKIK
jgi:hypothetical protein